jgi:predicted AAA+ superfamily ATPase
MKEISEGGKMLKRKILNDLLEWKSKDRKNALVITGARQVGKTFIIRYFAREQYKNVVYIDFERQPQFKTVFAGDLSTYHLISQLTVLLPGISVEPGGTVIILDEIQSCPQAVTSLKFFSQDGRYDVIATGSMLGMSYKEVSSFPVGYIERLEMYSLDFEEFLWANDIAEGAIEDLRGCFDALKQVPPAIHERMMQLFREYAVIGGMPAAVAKYAETRHFGDVLKLQRNIVRDYTDDIAKYAEGAEKAKARACFLSIPKQLSRDYKKFTYSIVDKHGSSRKYGGSLMWLYDAGVINFCYNLERIGLPFEGNAMNDAFKVYMRDTGLLVAMLEDGAAADLVAGNLGIYKGAIYENIVADILGKAGARLYYYEYRSRIEMDFFIRFGGELTAVETKSADHTKSKSMRSMIDRYGVKQGIKLSSKNVGYKDSVYTFPLYMAMFLV